MFPIWSIKSIENKHDVYRGKDYMKKFWEFLREHAMEIIIKPLAKEQPESYENTKICYIWKEKFKNKYVKDIL